MKRTTPLTPEHILTIAREAYSKESGGLCELPTLANARRHKKGDTLADFIVIELHEVLEGISPKENALAIAIRAMKSAQRQLQAIIDAFSMAPNT